MAIKKFKPTTHSRRWMVNLDFSEITNDRPQKSLITPLKKTGGRNAYGRITVRHRGGGHKRMYRIIDVKRDKFDTPGKIMTIEYDPNRTARLALVEYPDKERRYIIAPEGIKVGDKIISSHKETTEVKAGNCLPLRYIPQGTSVHNIELNKGKGGQIVRSAGCYAQVTAKEGKFAHLRLPSGEIRLIDLDCLATVGQVGNIEHEAQVLGKAGKARWLGIRPTVRGLAMNPIDHPHGGGEGKSGQGNPHPVSKWGWPTKGFKTRKRVKYSDRFIIKRRK